jgi:hypothetical protein
MSEPKRGRGYRYSTSNQSLLNDSQSHIYRRSIDSPHPDTVRLVIIAFFGRSTFLVLCFWVLFWYLSVIFQTQSQVTATVGDLADIAPGRISEPSRTARPTSIEVPGVHRIPGPKTRSAIAREAEEHCNNGRLRIAQSPRRFPKPSPLALPFYGSLGGSATRVAFLVRR